MKSVSPRAIKPVRPARLNLRPLEDRSCPATFGYAAATQTLTLTGANSDLLQVEALASKPPGYVLVKEVGSGTTVFNSDTSNQSVRNLVVKFNRVNAGYLGLDNDLVLGGNLTVLGAKVNQSLYVNGGVSGNVSYTAGSPLATDSIAFLQQAEVGGNVALGLGSGGNDVTFQTGYFGGSVSVTGGAGPDVILLGGGNSDVIIAGSAAFKLGNGENKLSASQDDPVRIGGSLTYIGGTGNDTIDLDNAAGVNRLEVGGKATFASGAGANSAEFDALTVGGSIAFTGGAGFDSIVVSGGLTVGGNVTIAPGNGENAFFPTPPGNLENTIGGSLIYSGGVHGDYVYLDGTTTGRNVSVALGESDVDGQFCVAGQNEAATVHGSLKITGSGKADGITLRSLHVGNALTVLAGGGTDVLDINDTQVAGTTRFDLGAGTDLLQIETTGFPTHPDPAMFGGVVTVKAGDGDDTLNLSSDADAGTHVHFGSKLVLQGGTGTDTVLNTIFNVFEVSGNASDFETVTGPDLT
jgi:hypothetical protein